MGGQPPPPHSRGFRPRPHPGVIHTGLLREDNPDSALLYELFFFKPFPPGAGQPPDCRLVGSAPVRPHPGQSGAVSPNADAFPFGGDLRSRLPSGSCQKWRGGMSGWVGAALGWGAFFKQIWKH